MQAKVRREEKQAVKEEGAVFIWNDSTRWLKSQSLQKKRQIGAGNSSKRKFVHRDCRVLAANTRGKGTALSVFYPFRN